MIRHQKNFFRDTDASDVDEEENDDDDDDTESANDDADKVDGFNAASPTSSSSPPPPPLLSFLTFLDARNITVVRGTLLDRVAPGGCLPPLRPSPPLHEQFPLQCTITRDVIQGCIVKVPLHRASILPGFGHHKTFAAHMGESFYRKSVAAEQLASHNLPSSLIAQTKVRELLRLEQEATDADIAVFVTGTEAASAAAAATAADDKPLRRLFASESEGGGGSGKGLRAGVASLDIMHYKWFSGVAAYLETRRSDARYFNSVSFVILFNKCSARICYIIAFCFTQASVSLTFIRFIYTAIWSLARASKEGQRTAGNEFLFRRRRTSQPNDFM
jgi:hypothetical protein